MADDQNTPHVYGGADPASRTPPTPEGLRGEASHPDVKATHRRLVAGGGAIEVEETSGVAAAEAGDHSGLRRDG